jgi:two-component system response regulator MprA
MGDDAPGDEGHIPTGKGLALKPRVLIVDDDEAIRESVEMALERRYEVSTAANGQAALAQLAAAPADVVLLDLMMPVLDGAGFVAEARRRGLELRIVIMSAGTELRTRAHELGVENYLQKPISLERLEQTLARVLAVPLRTVGP